MTDQQVADPQLEVAAAKGFDVMAGRRAFLAALGLGAAGAYIFAGSDEAQAQGITDVDIVNFALNLEYLESEFYTRAAFGRGLADADVTGQGTLGAVTGGRAVDFSSDLIVRQCARELAFNEERHVLFLRSVIGGPGAAIARPAINLTTSFTAVARASGLIGATETFDAFASPNNFLLAAFIFEDVGVTAYKGAAPLIQNKTILDGAAGLLAVEGYHAALLRTLLYERGLRDQTTAISNLRDSINGAEFDQGVNDTIVLGNNEFVTASNIVPSDAQGLAFSRAPNQVLNIVYGNINTPPTPGGFLPNGANGRIR